MTNEELFAFIKKNPISVTCGVIALAVGVAVYFRQGEIPAAEELLADKTAEATRHAANIKNATQLKEQFDAVVAANKEIDSRLIRASALGVNSEIFYKLESETGVKMIDFRPGDTVGSKGAKSTFAPIVFNVSVQGTLPQLLEYLRRLESGRHYCRVLSALVNSNSASRAAPLTLTLSFELLGVP